MKFIYSIFIYILSISLTFAQADFKNYDWNTEAQLLEVPQADAETDEVILKDKTIIIFDYDAEDNLQEHYISHTITLVNSDNAIEKNNKIYLPLAAAVEVIEQKTRVITPEGEVIEMKEEDIKEANIEDRTLRYFALKGLVKGAQIESYSKIKKRIPDYDGNFKIIQEKAPKYNASLDIISPASLVVASKAYNGLKGLEEVEANEDTEVSEEAEATEKKIFHLSQTWDYIGVLKEEEQSYHTANLKKIIYKIDKNLLRPRVDIVSYDQIAKRLYENIDIQPDKKLSKKIQKILKDAKLPKGNKANEATIVAVENFLKQNFSIIEQNAEELADINAILTNKVSSKPGALKLYCAIFNHLNIEHQIVLTNERDNHKFDPEFEAYNFLQNYLLYFPTVKKYLAPTATISKLGLVPPLWTNNYGLFIEPVSLGEFKTAKAAIKFIPPATSHHSQDEMYVEVSTNDNFKTLNVNYNKVNNGYYAQFWQPVYDFIDEQQKKEFREQQVKFLTEDVNIENIEVENATFADYGVKPYKFKTNFTTKAFMERAGEKILLKVGELIGPQVEMYQETERKLAVESEFNRRYYRELTINIPKGYTAKNLDELNFNEVYEEDGEVIATFVSNYTYTNNTVKVIIEEYYNKIDWPIELFETYRKIINAAADFNKVVLYIEK